MPRTRTTNTGHAGEARDVAAHRQALRRHLDAGTAPAGRLLGLPELDGDDVWCDVAAVSVLAGVAPSTITSWITRGRPSWNPFPQPDLRMLYRDLWRRSTVQAWLDAGGSPFGRSPTGRAGAHTAKPTTTQQPSPTLDSGKAANRAHGAAARAAEASAGQPTTAADSGKTAHRARDAAASTDLAWLLHSSADDINWKMALQRASVADLKLAIATLDDGRAGVKGKLSRLRGELDFRRHLTHDPTEQLQRLRDRLQANDTTTMTATGRLAKLDAELARRAAAGRAGDAEASASQPTASRAAGEGYTVEKSPHYAETHTWYVLVDGEQVGQVRPAFTAGRGRRWEPYLGGMPVQVLGSPSNTCKTVQDAAVQVLMAWRRTRRNRGRRRPQL
jgi:hypothetical protein